MSTEKTKKYNKLMTIAVAVSVMLLALSIYGCGVKNGNGSSGENDSEHMFPSFEGRTFTGEEIDNDVFKEKAVTIVNFWFNDCPACTAEMEELDKLNKDLKDKDGHVIGVNTDAFDGNTKNIEQAEKIMQKKKASYKNFWVTSDSELANFTQNITGYPTTYVVDRNGKISGDPLMGGIDNEALKEELKKQIEDTINKDKQK